MQQPRVIEPGLCKTCLHARVVRSPRGGVFWLCEAHKLNAKLQKYPPLPVLQCPEYSPEAAASESPS